MHVSGAFAVIDCVTRHFAQKVPGGLADVPRWGYRELRRATDRDFDVYMIERQVRARQNK
jgi:hypothetical protein